MYVTSSPVQSQRFSGCLHDRHHKISGFVLRTPQTRRQISGRFARWIRYGESLWSTSHRCKSRACGAVRDSVTGDTLPKGRSCAHSVGCAIHRLVERGFAYAEIHELAMAAENRGFLWLHEHSDPDDVLWKFYRGSVEKLGSQAQSTEEFSVKSAGKPFKVKVFAPVCDYILDFVECWVAQGKVVTARVFEDLVRERFPKIRRELARLYVDALQKAGFLRVERGPRGRMEISVLARPALPVPQTRTRVNKSTGEVYTYETVLTPAQVQRWADRLGNLPDWLVAHVATQAQPRWAQWRSAKFIKEHNRRTNFLRYRARRQAEILQTHAIEGTSAERFRNLLSTYAPDQVQMFDSMHALRELDEPQWTPEDARVQALCELDEPQWTPEDDWALERTQKI